VKPLQIGETERESDGLDPHSTQTSKVNQCNVKATWLSAQLGVAYINQRRGRERTRPDPEDWEMGMGMGEVPGRWWWCTA